MVALQGSDYHASNLWAIWCFHKSGISGNSLCKRLIEKLYPIIISCCLKKCFFEEVKPYVIKNDVFFIVKSIISWRNVHHIQVNSSKVRMN